jgi:CubicO group peptidase (beta-lactamase class C family)
MYPVSKSFASLAVGMMVDEGKLTLEDRVLR